MSASGERQDVAGLAAEIENLVVEAIENGSHLEARQAGLYTKLRQLAALAQPIQDTVPREKFDSLLAQEHALSNAYVRLREIIGAMNPPAVSDSQALWAYVEDVASQKVAALAQPQQEGLNLSDPAVQNRLAAQWGYVHGLLDHAQPQQRGALPDVTDLLVLAVEHRLIRLPQVMDVELQDRLFAYTTAALAASQKGGEV